MPGRTQRSRRCGALLLLAAGAARAVAPGAPVDRLLAPPDCVAVAAVAARPASDWVPLAADASAADRTPSATTSIWLRIRPAVDGDPASAETWTVAMPSNRAVRLTWYEPPDARPRSLDAADPRSWGLSFRHLGREFRPLAGGPTYVCFAGSELHRGEVEVVPAERFRRKDLGATQWRAVAFGVILAMSLFSALFYVALREFVFLKYLAYLLSFLLYLACETRAAHRLPFLSGLDVESMTILDGIAIDLASALATILAVDFVNLRRLTPRLGRLLLWFARLFLVLAPLHAAGFALGSDRLVQATIAANNLLVGCTALGVLIAVSLAARQQNRYAWFYLVGWTPLVLVAFAASLQQFLQGRTASLLLDVILVAGAFESVVLALGLADRTLSYRRELDRARELADRDALSGLLNRRALLRLTDALDAESDRRGGSLAVAMFDLDHFKHVNDEYGHLAGDQCIRTFSEHLAAEVRRADLAARYGGEEFVAVLPGASGEAASALAERVRRRIETGLAVHEGRAVPLTVSVGVAAGTTGEGVSALLERADRALYAAKAAGRNRVIEDLPVESSRG
ncbi:MAG: diguanylate cyclase [Thermoanaerobaculia bacterium]